MINESNKVLNTNITKLNKNLSIQFSTDIEKDIIEKGLNEQTVKLFQVKRTTILLDFRLKAYKKWKQIQQPEWAYLKFPQINFQDVIYYSAPKSQKKLKSFRRGSRIIRNFEN
jgi:Fe-S cluster assembly protein SufB